MAHVNTAHRGARIAAALVAVILGASSCGSDSKSSMPTAQQADNTASPIAGDAGQVASAETTADSETSGASPAKAPSVDLPAVALPENNYLAIDISYGIQVDDINQAINDVVALSGRHGGQIYERTINITDDRSSRASFVIKLPPKEIQPAIDELGKIGASRTASQGTEDLTSQVVDIDARLLSAQASLARVRKLLEAATDLGQVLSLESQLTERETIVEQLLAMKRALADRVSLATLRVELSVTPVPSEGASPDKPADEPTVGKAFKSGWNGFIKALVAIMIFIGYTAPFLTMLLICAAVLIPITRRHRRQPAQQSRSAAPPHPPAPDADPQTTERDSVGAAKNP
jgi:uncharacterized protein DUF4349